jgi:hypothetical protein
MAVFRLSSYTLIIRNQKMPKDKDHNLRNADWDILKNAVLSAQFTDEFINKIPTRLNDHPVTILIKKYKQTKNEQHINKAAKLLTGNIKNSWLFLEKS